jgi:hypothetical protein
MIVWPAVLKLEGDDELLYFASYEDTRHECSQMILAGGDVLIDSVGSSYQVVFTADNAFELHQTAKMYSAADLSLLIQAHEFNAAGRCIIKIHFSSVVEAIKALAY